MFHQQWLTVGFSTLIAGITASVALPSQPIAVIAASTSGAVGGIFLTNSQRSNSSKSTEVALTNESSVNTLSGLENLLAQNNSDLMILKEQVNRITNKSEETILKTEKTIDYLNQASELKIALLIDADNAPASKIEAIISEIAKYGVSNIRNAYGNWKNPTLKPWEECLHEHAIRPVQQFDYTKGKNATDAAMIIDAIDLLSTQQLDAFAIVSSDCDFTPLVMRILRNGLKVYGFGEKKTPLPFVYACSTFLYLETIDQTIHTEEASKVSATIKKTGKELKQDTKLISLLRSAISTTLDDDGWSNLSAIGTNIANQASFDPRNYGYAKLSGLFEAIDLFEIQRKNRSVYVRNKPKRI